MLRWSMSGRRIASSNEPHLHHHHHHLAGDWNWIGRDHHQHRHRRHDHSSQLRSPPSLHSMPPSRAQRGTAPSIGNDGHCYPDHVQVELPLCHQTSTPLHVGNRDQQCPTLIKREEKKADERIACDRERKKHSAKRIHGAFPKGQAGAFERTPLFQVSKTLTLLLCQKMMIALAPLHPKAQNVLNSCLL